MPRTKKLTASNPPTLDDARALEAQSEALTEKGHHDRAIELAGRALAIRHALVGDGVPALVDGLRVLGYALYMADRNEEALPYIAESVRIFEGLDGPADPRLVIDTYVTATLLQATGRQETAWPYFASWVAQSLGPDAVQDKKFPPVVLGLLRHYIASSQLPAALDLLDGAMPILAASLDEESPVYGRLLADHAFVLEASGRYQEGSEVAQASCALNLRVLGEHSSAYLSSLGRLASIRRALHDLAGARALAERVVALCAEAPDIGADHLPSAYWDLAENALATGDLGQAEAHFRRAIELFRTLPEASNNLAAALNGLGNLHAQTGHLAQAAEALHEALVLYTQLYGERSLLCGQLMSELAAVYVNADDLAEADRTMAESVAIVREAAGETHPAFARSLHDHAVIQRKLGHTDRARAMFEESTLALEAALGPNHLLVANHLQSLGDMNRADGRYAEAEAQLTRALAMMRPVLHPSHTNLRTTTRSLAAVHAATERYDTAMALISRELEGELEMTCQLFALSSEDQRMQLLAAGGALNVLLTLASRHFIDDAQAVRGAFEHVLRRKGMGAEALSAQREAVLAGQHPQLAAAIDALRELRERIARSALAGPGSEGAQTHASQLADWSAQRTAQEIELGRAIPELALATRLRVTDVATVESALPEGSALIDFVQFTPGDLRTGAQDPARLLAFVLTAGGKGRVRLFDLGEAAPIAQDLALFRASVTGTAELRAAKFPGRQEKADVNAGEKLRIALFDPLAPALGECRRLFISPDGALNRLPFEILPLAGGRRLIDDHTISYLSAGRDALRFGVASSASQTDPLVLADPDFDLAATTSEAATPRARSNETRSAGLSFARLPETRTEGELVSALLGGQSHYGAAAVERVVKACRSPRVLHLATHGFFLPDVEAESSGAASAGRLQAKLANPMLRSGLALAGANTWLANGALPEDAEDALFTAEDVSGLDLSATDLVVLSACETGLGEVQAGEGVFGLRRAFVLAGAKSLVISLWKVPDLQTQQLMAEFYRRVLAGAARADALREAQLLLKASNPDPLYWGAFICLGEPGPLNAGSARQPTR